MKNLVNAVRKEECLTPIALLIAICIYILQGLFDGVVNSVMSWINNGVQGIPFLIDKLDTVTTIAFTILICVPACLILYLLYLVAKRDRALQKLTRDERELQHEYDTSHLAYQILSGLLFYYWLLADPSNPWLISILLVTFIFRLWRRLELEYRG